MHVGCGDAVDLNTQVGAELSRRQTCEELFDCICVVLVVHNHIHLQVVETGRVGTHIERIAEELTRLGNESN